MDHRDEEHELLETTRDQRLAQSSRAKSRRARYASDPIYRATAIEDAKRAYQKVRAAILGAYGGRCTCCGESEPMFLELDHVHGGGAAELRTGAVAVYRRVIKEGFPDRYRLLCSNCNTGRHRNGGVCPHQVGK